MISSKLLLLHHLLLLIFAETLSLTTDQQTLVLVNDEDFHLTSIHFDVEVSSNNHNKFYSQLNLMLPPHGADSLCTISHYNESNADLSKYDMYQSNGAPIGLLVSPISACADHDEDCFFQEKFVGGGDCSFQEKVANVISINHYLFQFQSLVKFLIVPTPEGFDTSDLTFSEESMNSTEGSSLENDVTIVYFPTKQLKKLWSLIRTEEEEGNSPFLFEPTNVDYNLRFYMLHDTSAINYRDHDHSKPPALEPCTGLAFYFEQTWFGLAVLVLLGFTTIFLIGYYFWRRRRFNQLRSEVVNRIALRLQREHLRKAGILTDEQFQALPVVEFSLKEFKQQSIGERHSDSTDDTSGTSEKHESTAVTRQRNANLNTFSDDGVTPGSNEDPPQIIEDKDLEEAKSTHDDVSDDADTSMNVVDDAQPSNCPTGNDVDIESRSAVPVTNCCSICIDDFTDGEKIVLLPRCDHAYHKDCIRQWLLEKQGCCPMCKTNVLEGSDDDDDDDSDSESSIVSSISSSRN